MTPVVSQNKKPLFVELLRLCGSGLYDKNVRKFDNLNDVVKVAGHGVIVCC